MQTPQEGAMVDEQQQHLQQFPRATTNRPDAESQPAGVIGGEQTQPALQRRLRGLLYLACQLPSTPSWISSLFTWLLASFFSLFYNSAITKGHDHRHRDFGLVQRYPDPDDKEATSSAQVDIIALPGLSAWAPKTFEAYNNGQDVSDGCTDWLTDHNMLPTKVPGARVLTYNWESNYKGPRSSVRFAETANNFLLDLHEERKRVGRLKRPIVFVASCFGGLLLAKALVRALERSGPRQQDYNRIADWTVGAIFLGTPFRGSWKFGTENARKQIEFARRNNIEVSPELVEYLRPHNREDAGQSPSPLNESVQRFFEIIRDERFGFPVVCFYECLPTDREAFMKNLPLGYKWNSKSRGQELVVPEESATIDGFEIVPLDCRHNMLWKHSSPKGEAFVRICGRVEDMIEGRQAILWSRARNQESEELIIPRQIKEYIKVGFYDDESSNEHMKQHDVFRTRQLGTCLTFLNSRDFDCWRTSPKASTLLCIGDAGAGKTVVASVAIDCLSNLVKEAKRCALAFLYCEYRFENTKDFAGRPTESAGRQSVIDNYLRCILRQLISPCPYVDDAVETMYKMWKEEQRQPDMDESTTALRYVAESFSEVYVVIDALDECSVGVRRKLLRTLTDLQTDLENESGVRMHLMITSRFDVIDGIELNSQSVQKMYIKASGDDVKLYLKANIGEISDHLAHDAGEAIKQRILDTIAITADGMFLLARLQLWTLSNKITDAEIETALEELSEAYKHSVKGRSPEHVRKTYTEAYHKTMNTINSQPQEVRERVKRALNWILHSPHALTVAQFETVLGFPVKLDRMKCSEDIDCKPFKRILIDCAGLVKEEEQRVRLVHYTTQQYLDGHISAIIPTAYQEIESLQITDSASSKHLMLSCIAYLALDDFGIGPKRRSDDEPLINTATNAHTYEKTLSDEKYLNYKNLGSRKTSEDWEKDYPFHDYAAKNWARYAEELAVNFTEDESAMEIFSRFFGDDRKILAAAKHLGLVHYGYNYSHNTLYGLWSRWRARPHLALHFVTHFGRSDVAKLLLSLSRRASGSKHRIGTATELLCSTDRQGFTPLCLAALQGDCRMLEAFLEYGDAAETGHLSNRGKPLRLAALSGSRKAVELLLEKTLDGAVDAMIVGVKQNDESLVKILLHRRVDPDKEAISRAKKAKSGNTARLLARGMKRGRITDLFNRADSGDLEPLCDLDFEDYDWTRANPGNAMTSFEKFQRQYSMWQRNIEL